MLRVKIELVPGGQEELTETLDVVYIGNDGRGNHSVSHYDVYVEDPRGQPYPRRTRRGWIKHLKWISRRGPKTGRIHLAIRALQALEDHYRGFQDR
jgi:hypothetical protein